MTDLAGAVAIVTGAARGIGRATALALAAEGAAVVCNGRPAGAALALPGSVEETAAAIASRGGRAIAVRADVSRPAGAARVVASARRAFGRLDVLVSNAMARTALPLLELDARQWRESVDANVDALFHLCRLAVPLMSGRGGSIVVVSSGMADAARRGIPATYLPYAVAKAALERFAVAFADLVAEQGIAVNAVRPGAVRTPMAVHELGEGHDWSGWRSEEDAARAIVWVARQRPATMSGRILDGTRLPPPSGEEVER